MVAQISQKTTIQFSLGSHYHYTHRITNFDLIQPPIPVPSVPPIAGKLRLRHSGELLAHQPGVQSIVGALCNCRSTMGSIVRTAFSNTLL